MATFYLDYEGGSDAADGTSFANRWKTITSGATAARIAPGDTIRIMGSPAPTSLGINATWTNKSATVTLSSALNALITNCDSAWTASANVTSTADTAVYRTSTGSAKHVIAAGFTTGLASYFALGGAQDYSAYQGITLWVQVTVKTLAAGELSIRLCSDAAGVTTVDTLALPAITQTGQWVPVHIDKGSALGSSIQSIALYGDTDNGAITVYLDNISTTKAVGNDCLTLQSLIGKNTTGEYWWALRGISGTTLTVDVKPNMAPSASNRGYYGTTESVTTYKRETIKTALVGALTTAVQAVQDSGTAGNLITYSGGWNRTDMSTQTLETWFDGQSGFGYGLHVNSMDYIRFDKLCAVRYDRGYLLNGSFTDHTKLYAGHCDINVYMSAPDDFTVDEIHSWSAAVYLIGNLNGSRWSINTVKAVSLSGTQPVWPMSSSAIACWYIGNLTLCNGGGSGLSWSAASYQTPIGVQIGTLVVSDNAGIGWNCGEAVAWRIGSVTADSNGGDGVDLSSVGGSLVVDAMTCTNNVGYGLDITLMSGVGAGTTVIGSLTTSGNTIASARMYGSQARIAVLKSSLAEATKITGSGVYPTSGSISFQNFNGVAGDHRTYGMGLTASNTGIYEIFSEGTVRHTASGLAWKISPKSTAAITSVVPVVFSVGKVSLAASVTKTITVWVRRTNTGITAKLIVRKGQLDGITTDQVATAAAAQDTWEQLSVNVTPTIAGVIDVEVHAYGGSTYSVYVDDLGVS